MIPQKNNGGGAAQKRSSSLIFIILGAVCVFILPILIILGSSAATNTPRSTSILANIDQTYDIDRETWVGMPPVKNTTYDVCDVVTKQGKTLTFTDQEYSDDKGVVFHIEEPGNYVIKCHDTHKKEKYTPTAIMVGPKEAFIHPVADIVFPLSLAAAGISFLAGIALIIVGIVWRVKKR